jgi:bifunctional ADP-heptose synthase (sugar kinase/adenylyltransferase)
MATFSSLASILMRACSASKVPTAHQSLGGSRSGLSALSCVDHIVAFHQDTPHELIRVVKPDVFVKGGDYTRETLPEAPLVEEQGGEVRILPYVKAQSTTGVIERIRSQSELEGMKQ